MADTRFPAAEELGRRVRIYRRSEGLSLERLGFEAELHPTYIGRVERGQANLTLRSILRIADALHVDGADLVRGLHV